MPITERGLNLIKHFESFSPTPYLDAAGLWTIGWGHLLVGAPETFPQSISQEDASMLLEKDVARAEHAVSRLIRVPLSSGQFDALASFTFNLGPGALQRSTLRARVNRGEHDAVPAEFMKWVWAGGRKLAGLIRRRQAEANLYLS